MVSIAAIGIVTAVIGDIAGHLGCFIYLKDCVNAIGFVALGTSVPGQYGLLSMEQAVSQDRSVKPVDSLTHPNKIGYTNRKHF